MRNPVSIEGMLVHVPPPPLAPSSPHLLAHVAQSWHRVRRQAVARVADAREQQQEQGRTCWRRGYRQPRPATPYPTAAAKTTPRIRSKR